MRQTIESKKNVLYREIDGLPQNKLGEVLNFIRFMKVRDSFDIEQMYFLSKEWQRKERQAERDKKKGLIIGDGSAESLINALKK